MNFFERYLTAWVALSEASIAGGNRTVDFPDFTEGSWRDRTPAFAPA